ncbi:restriction endonuclease subunit S [Enterococcus casseliflavus]|uniref:restriction endonuclease subunit S n=1 Tax=Enterococcus casseliflavus TaxID=37734 RepID=UPI00288E3790|nr:restriction endonuclease subunit S [Enterococcus casseliflavus]MDT2987657.1 restriction endonuclease subunit S [Enterococcus casseliflavus]
MSNDTQPEIRFPGFTDDWEQRKLKDVTERVRSNDGRMDLPTLTMSASSGWLDQKDRFSGDISGKEKKNYTLLKKGELSYNHGNSKLAKYGVVFSLTNYEEALVPRVYHSFKALENTSADFIEYMFSTKLPDRELGKLVSSGARMDGLLNINYDDFMNIHISIPNYEEQILMSSFFRKLDEIIALHQRKLDLLKETKKGFLQKMFPKNGAKVPEIRFPGFTEDWEERKLQEVLRERNNQQPQSMEYPLVSFTVENGVTPKTDRYEREQLVVGDKSSKKYKVTVLNDIVYNPANLKFGAISRNKYGNAVFSPIYITFLVNNDVTTPEFIEMFVTRNDFIKRALKYQQGTVYERQSVSPTDLLAMNVYLPGKSEQEKIGSFFQQLDETIALHQRKLDLLKETKKGFLQKMFV